MAQVTIKINGYAYTVGCQDGEEAHLQAMADQIEERVAKAKSLGQSGESKLLVMAALMMADELHDLQIELRATQKGRTPAAERSSTERMKKLAARAEAIATTVEQS